MKPMKETAEPTNEKNKPDETTAAPLADVVSCNPRTEDLFDGAMQAFLVLFQRVAQQAVDKIDAVFARDPYKAVRLTHEMTKLISLVTSVGVAQLEMQIVKSQDYRERQELKLIKARRQLKKLRQQMLKAARSRTSPSGSTT